jgi:hypothetical protein
MRPAPRGYQCRVSCLGEERTHLAGFGVLVGNSNLDRLEGVKNIKLRMVMSVVEPEPKERDIHSPL